MRRRNHSDTISNQQYDIAIVGGGITGAGILLEAAKRGYNTILLEKDDFASGTSSKSAKLVHGGIRYLANMEFRLVRESLQERNNLLRQYPHLVQPQPFCFPVYSSTLKYRIGFFLYNLLSWDDQLPGYQFLGSDETVNKYPYIDQNGLKGSFIYYDGVTDDARLTNEVIALSRYRYGADALNYSEVKSGEHSQDGVTLHCEDKIEGREISISAKYVLNATGAWTDDVLGKLDQPQKTYGAPSKGAHIVLSQDRFPIKTAMGFSSYADDGRYLYAIPWHFNSVIIGTTDTDYKHNPDDTSIQQDDIDYMLHAVQHFMPELNINKSDIISTYVGLRPLYQEDKSSEDRSRDYRIWWEGQRMLNILGGKLTSFHSMAKTMINTLEEVMPAPNVGEEREIGHENVIDHQAIAEEVQSRIRDQYAAFAPLVLAILLEDEHWQQPLAERYDVLLGELVFFIRHQQCVHIDDLLTRRVPLSYMLPAEPEGKQLIRYVADLFQKEWDLTDEEKEEEIKRGDALLKTPVPQAEEK